MWSFFSRDRTKDFGYEIGDHVQCAEDKSLWSLHKGKKKGTEQDVSVFVFQVEGDNDAQLETAKASVKRIKTLRHPNILQYIDSLETEKIIYLVTEYVEPLVLQVKSLGKDEETKLAISWGLYQVAKGLAFLTEDCGLSHNNICSASVFVDKAGQWKIAGFDYMCPAADTPPPKTLPELDVYTPPELGGTTSGSQNPAPKWARDSYGLGCLTWEVFNGPLPNSSSLQRPGKIPKSLVPVFNLLVNPNPSSRISQAKFITKGRSHGGFLKNSFIDTMLFVEEIQIKDMTEKNRFFTGLTSLMENFPANVCRYKILPQLLNAFEFSDAGSTILAPLFKIGKMLSEEEYRQKIVPCIVKLFSSKDRATRARLLQQVDQFIEHLEPDVVNQEVFPNVIQGFLDTNPTIREQTVKAMVHMAPKLNYRNLNEELMKHFARLQVRDDQGGIRTNTTVCLGKIACYLDPQVRQKVLIVAFTRSMRDPFHPARMAGILALSATQGYFTIKDCAVKVLPVLCSLTMDPEKSVRDQAFRAIKGFLGKLEKVSEDPSLIEQMEADVNAAGASVHSSMAASWAGWAVSSLTSKFYKSPLPSKPVTAEASLMATRSEDATRKLTSQTPSSRDISPENVPGGFASDTDDKWESQEWGSMEEESSLQSSCVKATPSMQSQDGWEDCNWESLDDIGLSDECSPTDVPSASKVAPEMDSGNGDQKTSWECDADWDKWGSGSGKGDTKSDEMKRKREERRQQRLKEQQERRAARQGAGPLKLGVRKEFVE
ncbi:N-terminal kinase-like protein [Ornithodoros turicata]|uniref:N-terminal kinase-like protein n=1 Tax=Ornithodoros turicata TaxID=34597 RepID=UPI003139D83A